LALTEYGDIQFRYNSYEDTDIKDYLPIIGKEIPNKQISLFDGTETWTLTAAVGVTDLGQNKE